MKKKNKPPKREKKSGKSWKNKEKVIEKCSEVQRCSRLCLGNLENIYFKEKIFLVNVIPEVLSDHFAPTQHLYKTHSQSFSGLIVSI